jgi:hypothetical protein
VVAVLGVYFYYLTPGLLSIVAGANPTDHNLNLSGTISFTIVAVPGVFFTGGLFYAAGAIYYHKVRLCTDS